MHHKLLIILFLLYYGWTQAYDYRIHEIENLSAYASSRRTPKLFVDSEFIHRRTIQYVVITGQQTINRSLLLWKTWGRLICHPDRIIFITDGPLSHDPPFSTIIAYDIGQNATLSEHYRRSQLKWFHALFNVNLSIYFDWLVLVDDDTFIITPSLSDLLQDYDPDEPMMIGKKGADCHLICGGAGLVISRNLVSLLILNKSKLQKSFEIGEGIDKKIHSDVVLTHFIRANKLGKKRIYLLFQPLVSISINITLITRETNRTSRVQELSPFRRISLVFIEKYDSLGSSIISSYFR